MPSLADTQRHVRNVILGASAEPLHGVIADDRLGYARRLNVYRNNTHILLGDALAANFPIVAALVGTDFFAAMAKVYLRTHPPRDPRLFAYGADFADAIDTYPDAKSLPYLGDVARLEWAIDQALYAQDADPIDIAALSAVSPDDYGRLHFHIHPAAHVVTSDYPIHAIWTIHQPGHDVHDGVDANQGAQTVLVTRPHDDVRVALLGPGGDVFFQSVSAGASLDDATACAQATVEAFDVQHALTVFFTSGAFSAHTLQ